MTRPGRRNQRIVLIFAFISMALMPVLLLSIPLFTEVRKMLQSGAERELTLEADTVAGRVETEIESTLDRALSLASEGDIQRAARIPVFVPKADRALRAFLRTNRVAAAIFFVDTRGSLITAAPWELTTAAGGRFRRAIADRCLAFRGNQSGFSEFYADPADQVLTRERAIVLSIPVFNPTLDVWSGALCVALPWKNVLRAALSRINSQPMLSDILLDGRSLLHSSGDSRSDSRDLVQASVSLSCHALSGNEGRLSVQVAETRMLWLAKFYNALASFALVATTLVALIAWAAFWLLKRAIDEPTQSWPTTSPSPSSGKPRPPRPTPVIIPLPRSRND